MKRALMTIGLSLFSFGLVFATMVTNYESATDGTATVTVGPSKAKVVVKAGTVRHYETGSVKFYAKGGAGKVTPTTLPAAGAVTVLVSNASYALTNADMVLYYHSSADVCDVRTVSASAATYIVLDSAISSAGASGDQVYELTQQGQVSFIGSNVTALAENCFVTPDASPLHAVADTTGGSDSNVVLNLTVDKLSSN